MHLLRSRSLLLCLLAGLALSAPARAATWAADASVSDERKTEVTGAPGAPTENPTTETVKQAYSVKYELEVDPALSFALDLSLDITHEIKEGPKPDEDFDSYEIKPEVGLDVQGVWWDLTANWSDTSKSTQGSDSTEDMSWDVELGMQPGSDVAPEATVKYKRDANWDAGVVQKQDDAWEGSLDYSLYGFMDISLDAQRTYSDDKVQADQDKEDRKLGIDVSADHEIGENFKIEGKWTNERSQSKTYLDDGEVKEPYTDTLKNSVEGKATYTPWEPTEISVDRKIEWTADMFNPADDDVEVTDTLTTSLSFDQSLTQTIDVSASYDDERKDARGNADSDANEINRDYSMSVDFSPLETTTLSASYDRADDRKWPDHPKSEEESETKKIDNKWEIKLETSMWDDNVKFSATRSLNDSTEDGEETTRQNKWDVKFELSYDDVPNLEVTPNFAYTQDNDLIKNTTTEERKIELGVNYEVSLGDVLTFSVDHKYTRTSKTPAEGVPTLSRDDATDLTLTWSDFFDGMQTEVAWTRKATDESKDNKGPVVDYTYKFTYDWDFLENYTFSLEYNYDKKQDSQDNQKVKSSFSVDLLDGLVTLSLEHEYEEQIKDDDGDETKDIHRYLIELEGKF